MLVIGAAAFGLILSFYIYVLVQFGRELVSARKARNRPTPWPPLVRRSATLTIVPSPAPKETILASSKKSDVAVLSPSKAAFSARPRAKGSS